MKDDALKAFHNADENPKNILFGHFNSIMYSIVHYLLVFDTVAIGIYLL